MNYEALNKYAKPVSDSSGFYDFDSARADYLTYCEKGKVSDPKLQQCLDYLSANPITLDVTSHSFFPWTDNNNSCLATERRYMRIFGMERSDGNIKREGIILESEGEPYMILKRQETQNLLPLRTVRNSYGDIILLKGGIYRADPAFLEAMAKKHPYVSDYPDWLIEDTSRYSQSVHFDRFLLPVWIEAANKKEMKGDISDVFKKMADEVARVKKTLQPKPVLELTQ